MRKKLISKMLVVLVLLSFVFASSGIAVYAATVGQQLPTPENGWRRYDDNHPYFKYDNNWIFNIADYYIERTQHTSGNLGVMRCKFIGSKIRVIAYADFKDTRDERVSIIIDGEEYFYSNRIKSHTTLDSSKYSLVFEKLDLDYGVHEVFIHGNTKGLYMNIDAIDIDEDGELLDANIPNALTNLVATAGDTQVNLTWDAVEGATGYNVKRSLTDGGPYTTVTEAVYGTGYTDNDVVNGTTYYYVVSAIVDGKESANSNEASATPQAGSVDPTPTTGNAILTITMVNGEDKEYDLPMSTISEFINWYESKGSSKPYFMIEKNFNKGPFKTRKDYISYDKIVSFEVNEY
ncbi:fibronectin type III domain-containing protein [Geosporobacter ferrireducens]|uniref:fibronectin type III domain-containing protein n=1 Tax=Geosporobacter ferrireducens TaxID=1424294 RepID=UPI00139EFDF4|nr:fibronectin type III domain-containing protein [Geosporobacter ferrireducens]MTI56173.1 fibronectin type III domain-containing protein [Geosporobacter ferrireducens]